MLSYNRFFILKNHVFTITDVLEHLHMGAVPGRTLSNASATSDIYNNWATTTPNNPPPPLHHRLDHFPSVFAHLSPHSHQWLRRAHKKQSIIDHPTLYICIHFPDEDFEQFTGLCYSTQGKEDPFFKCSNLFSFTLLDVALA